MSGEYISKAKATSFPFANDQYDHVHADPHFIAGCETYKEWLNSIPAADVVEVRHGRWVKSHKHVWQLDESGKIDMWVLVWVLDHGFHNGPRCVICRKTFCEHCTPDWKTTKCDTEHYECSECGNISLTKTAYCPSCGAVMDGGQDE